MDAVILFVIAIAIILIVYVWVTDFELSQNLKDRCEGEKKIKSINENEKKKIEDNEFYDWLIPKVEKAGNLEGENYDLEEGASDEAKESLAKYQKDVNESTKETTNGIKKTQDGNINDIKEGRWKKEVYQTRINNPPNSSSSITTKINIIIAILAVIIALLSYMK
jgi:hypothetical protein